MTWVSYITIVEAADIEGFKTKDAIKKASRSSTVDSLLRWKGYLGENLGKHPTNLAYSFIPVP